MSRASRTSAPVRDAWLEVTTSGWFDVTLLEDGAIARRQYAKEVDTARALVVAWCDLGKCLALLDDESARCWLDDGHEGPCAPSAGR